MNAVERLDTQIAALQGEIASTELIPATIAERFAVIEGDLRNAERLYRDHGLNVSSAHPGEAAHLQRQTIIGACMVIGADKLLKVERERIAAAGEGLSAPDKARRLDRLRHQILQAAARRELLVRDLEGDNFMVRPVHPELAIYNRTAVERLAAS
ncbi:hypothetical protein SAMN02990966_06933 [Rhodospirillales bacterium URHD0017]|nr:hypothetical protein SAMN02990966_06933 [Rhodospirillales bacterium URHD0017]